MLLMAKRTKVLGLQTAAVAVRAGFYANAWNGYMVWPQVVMFVCSVSAVLGVEEMKSEMKMGERSNFLRREEW